MHPSSSRTERVLVHGKGALAAEAEAWIAESTSQLVARWAQADIVVVCEPALLPIRRTEKLCLAFVGGNLAAWTPALRRAALDGVVATDSTVSMGLSSVAVDAEQGSVTFLDMVEEVRSRPRIAIGTSVRFERRSEFWGDTHFALDLSDALRHFGWRTEVQTHTNLRRRGNRANDVLLYLRGLRPCPPVSTPSAGWVISHPAAVTDTELQRHDLVFASGRKAAETFQAEFLLQATNPSRFFDDRSEPGLCDSALFVGNGRGRERPSVRYALEAGVPLKLVGPGWRGQHRNHLVAEFVANDDLRRYYSSARIVLNDHWPDMAEYGMISNRVFDALACGTAVLTDGVTAFESTFGDSVLTYRDQAEFTAHLRAAMSGIDEDEARLHRRNIVLNRHTFTHRAMVLDGALRQLINESG